LLNKGNRYQRSAPQPHAKHLVVRIKKSDYARFNEASEKFHNRGDGTGVEMEWTHSRYDSALESLGKLPYSTAKIAMKKELDRVNLML
jgi:hypothetical protein